MSLDEAATVLSGTAPYPIVWEDMEKAVVVVLQELARLHEVVERAEKLRDTPMPVDAREAGQVVAATAAARFILTGSASLRPPRADPECPS